MCGLRILLGKLFHHDAGYLRKYSQVLWHNETCLYSSLAISHRRMIRRPFLRLSLQRLAEDLSNEDVKYAEEAYESRLFWGWSCAR